MNEVIDGIKRRLDDEECFRDGNFYVLRDLLKDNGLPSPDSHTGGFDSDYISFMADVFELLERATDAGEADRRVECAFIERQIDAAIVQAKQRWGGSADLVRARIMFP